MVLTVTTSWPSILVSAPFSAPGMLYMPLSRPSGSHRLVNPFMEGCEASVRIQRPDISSRAWTA
ncbi:hypothetical protein [Streptomyces nojiriensis]|uniref:hypothetical protein n=1 Tax=Streptomyces nojiriensis TaxID=66374 RepID=UPI00167827CD|nr:hypothetical protein [Streptomyces nojiriensis]